MLDTAGSKTDSLLPKAEPIKEAGGTWMEKRLKKGKTCCVAVVRERNEANNTNKITALQAPRSMKKEREEVLQALDQRWLYSPWRRLSGCRPWRIISEQISTVQDSMLKQGNSVRRKGRQRGAVIWTNPKPYSSIPLCLEKREVEESGSWAGRNGIWGEVIFLDFSWVFFGFFGFVGFFFVWFLVLS